MSKEERAMEAARMLRDFCADWPNGCKLCPFITDGDLDSVKACLLGVPLNWELPNKKARPAGAHPQGAQVQGRKGSA